MKSDLEEVKGYLNIYDSDNDKLITVFINAAEEQLLNAGVKPSDSFLYKLAVMMYTQEYYDNRGIVELPESTQTAITTIILQIRDV